MKTTYTLAKDTADFFNLVLAREDIVEKYKKDDTMEVFTVELDNGYQVDFKLMNGTETDSPWLDVVLFDELGNELESMIGDNYQIQGTYTFGDIEVEIV